MLTKGTNGTLREIVGSVIGGSHSVRSCIITVGVVFEVVIVIVVASIPTTAAIFCSCTCCTVSVGIGTNFVYELAVLIHQFINMCLLLVDLGLLFSDDLQQVVVLSCHLLYVLFVSCCRYRYFAEIVC